MMLYPAMNELLAQVPSRYKLVNVVARRAREIAIEAEEQGILLEDKTVSIAVREIAEGKVPVEPQEDEFEAVAEVEETDEEILVPAE